MVRMKQPLELSYISFCELLLLFENAVEDHDEVLVRTLIPRFTARQLS
jgi:hypothetical protein